MYMVRRWWGEQTRNLSPDGFENVILEVRSAGEEHLCASLTHESEWALSFYRDGLLVFENVEDTDAPPRHLRDVGIGDTVSYWSLLAVGDLTALERLPWLPGYG